MQIMRLNRENAGLFKHPIPPMSPVDFSRSLYSHSKKFCRQGKFPCHLNKAFEKAGGKGTSFPYYASNQCSANRVLTLQVYVFRYQNRVNFEVNSVSGKIERFGEFDRVNTQ